MVVNYLSIFLGGYYMPLVGVLFNSHHIPLYCRYVPRYCHYVPLSLFRFIPTCLQFPSLYSRYIFMYVCVCAYSPVFPLYSHYRYVKACSTSIPFPYHVPLSSLLYIYIHYIMHVYLFDGYYTNKTT